MFPVVLPPIIRSAYNCIYSIWFLSHRYCYLPLSWESWNWFECAVGGVCHPQHPHSNRFSHFPISRHNNSEEYLGRGAGLSMTYCSCSILAVCVYWYASRPWGFSLCQITEGFNLEPATLPPSKIYHVLKSLKTWNLFGILADESPSRHSFPE
jgi:hypothetical protein